MKGLDLISLLSVADNLGIHEKQSSLVFLIKNLWECFIQRDATRVRINPLVFTRDHKFYAANPLIRVDEAALYRQ
jgi:succinyl-CoA synthetase beta subunit